MLSPYAKKIILFMAEDTHTAPHPPPPHLGTVLQENGGALLLENGGFLLLEANS